MASRLPLSEIPKTSRTTDSRSLKRKKDDDPDQGHTAKPNCKCEQSYDVYILGAIGMTIPPDNRPTNDFQRYDFVHPKWTPLLNSDNKPLRIRFAVTTRENEIWVLGGRIGEEGSVVKAVSVYNTESNGWVGRLQMNHAREKFCAAFVGSRLFAIGGRGNGDVTAKASVEEYCQGEWKSRQKMSYGRHDFASCVIGNQIFVVGGVSNARGDEYVRYTEIYDTLVDGWIDIRGMASGRKSFGLVHSNDKTYVVGGDDDHTVIWNKSIRDQDWLAPVATIRPLPSYDAFALGREIYVVGKTPLFGSFQKFCPENSRWCELTPPHCPWRGGVRVALVQKSSAQN